jgi:hypothetical protein
MNTGMPNAAQLENLQNLTQNYAQFSRNRAGLAYLLLLLLLPIDFFLARLLPLNLTGAILGGLLCAISIIVWLLVRWKIADNIYQKFGVARAVGPIFDRDYFFGLLFGLAIVALRFRFSPILNPQVPDTFNLVLPTLVIVALIAFREYRQNGIVLGAVIVTVGIMISGGINANASNLSEAQHSLNLVVLMLIPISFAIYAIYEHLQFKSLMSELENLKTNHDD